MTQVVCPYFIIFTEKFIAIDRPLDLAYLLYNIFSATTVAKCTILVDRRKKICYNLFGKEREGMNFNLTQDANKIYDVVVVGGGPSGIAAAVSAREMGASVLVIERAGVVGGNLTHGHVGPMMGGYVKNSMADEINELLKPNMSPDLVHDFEDAKIKLTELLSDRGVNVILNSTVCAAECEDKEIKNIAYTTQSGLCTVGAKIFIDASGDGVLSYLAGEQIEVGRDDHLCQPCSIMFTINGIKEGCQIICKHEEMDTPLPCGIGYLELCKNAEKSGELPKNVNIVRLYDSIYPDEQMVNATQANGYDSLDTADYTRAQIELREQMGKVVDFLRNNIKGYENIRIKDSSDVIGVRESRRVMGKYILTAEDLIEGRRFDDVVVHNAFFAIDIHNPSGCGQSESEGLPQQSGLYDIPYRALLPNVNKNLLTAGRCISGTHRAHASYRVMNICLNIGQAAGIAAGLSITKGITPDLLLANEIQKVLTNKGIDLYS